MSATISRSSSTWATCTTSAARSTEKGRGIRDVVSELFERHAKGLIDREIVDLKGMDDITTSLRRMERYWTDQIRYIY